MLDARESIIIKTLQKLSREDVVLIGGYAVNAYVPPRFSIDCDLVVLGSSSKLESLLKKDGFRKTAEGDVSYGEYVRYETKNVKVSFDLLENSVVDRDTRIVFEGELFKKHSAERTTVGRSVPTRIKMRIADPELLFAMKFVSARRQDVRDMFMLAGANLDWDLVTELLSAKCDRKLMGERSHAIMRDVKSKTFRDSLHGPFGRIPNERFDLCRRRLVEFLGNVSTSKMLEAAEVRVDPKDPLLGRRRKLGLGVKSQLLVYRYADALIMKKLDVKDVEKRLSALYRRIDARTAKYGELKEVDIQREIGRYREEKRKQRA